MNKAGAIFIFPLVLAGGCSQGLLPELDRVDSDPVVSAPRVRSFATELCIEVDWEEDAAADEYLLERAEDTLLDLFKPVYRGQKQAYLDTSCQDQGRYLYRLRKLRGSRDFGPSEPILGIASDTCHDELEPNDVESQATSLTYDRYANLFFYRATPGLYPGAVVQDTDWYTVEVPPRRIANIRITQAGLAPGSQYTFLNFYLKGMSPQRVVNNDLIQIPNPSNMEKNFAFKLFPNPDNFILEATLGGGTLIDYSVSLHSIVNL